MWFNWTQTEWIATNAGEKRGHGYSYTAAEFGIWADSWESILACDCNSSTGKKSKMQYWCLKFLKSWELLKYRRILSRNHHYSSLSNVRYFSRKMAVDIGKWICSCVLLSASSSMNGTNYFDVRNEYAAASHSLHSTSHCVRLVLI